MDADKRYKEKARWELHEYAMSYIEQIQEATPHETIAIWPLISKVSEMEDKTNKLYGTVLEK